MKKTIKYYGLFDMTKKQYVYAQIGAFIFLALLWLAVIFIDISFLGEFATPIYWFVVALLGLVTIGEIIETVIMLRKFNKI